jgi:O-antigen ligase
MILDYLFSYGLYIGFDLVICIGFVLASAVSLTRPRYLAYAYLGIFLTFTASTHGLLDATRVIYGRGSGQLILPLVTWALWFLAIVALIAQAFNRQITPAFPMRPWFFALGLLFAGHVVTALFLEESFVNTVSPLGFITLVNMGILVAAMLRIFRTHKDVEELTNLFLGVVALRALFGIARFVIFKGDPANVYANFHDIAVRITFFDIADNLTACMAFFIAAWRVIYPRPAQSSRVTLVFSALALLELTIILFSFRRTAWFGLLLAVALLLVLMPSQKRFVALIAGVPLMLTAIVLVAAKRLGQEAKGAGLVESFFHEFAQSSIGRISERELELRMVWQTIEEHFLLGVGAWGRYQGAGISWQMGPDAYMFVHSGLLHIWLKAGLIGVFLFIAVFVSFTVWFMSTRPQISPDFRPIFYAGPAGILFLVPTFIAGTPVAEIRTTQLLAFALVLPILAYLASRTAQIEKS